MRLALFGLWLFAVLTLMAVHVVWRDEVRALSYALQGDNVFAMLRALRGEGHPALWYLLLRGAHALVPVPQVLPALAFVIAAAAVWLLVFHSPFRLSVIALLLATNFVAYEYSVMARNYGISMLLMFLIAVLYEKWNNRGCVLGLLLLLLANTNTYSVILVSAFLLFWMLEVIVVAGIRWSRELKVFSLNALLAVMGMLLCWLTVHPLINDAAVIDHSGGVSLLHVVSQAVSPSPSFQSLLTFFLYHLPPERIGPTATRLLPAALSMCLFGATLGLLPRPAALIAAVAALVLLSILFGSVAPGLYRHAALWLAFVVSLYWIEGAGVFKTLRERAAKAQPRAPAPEPRAAASGSSTHAASAGSLLFVVLLVAQIPATKARLAQPGNESRSADLGKLIAHSAALKDAIIIADPDSLVESVPYFLSNPTYLLREHRFGPIPVFRRTSQLQLTLAQVLDEARRLRSDYRRPVVIMLQQRLHNVQQDMTYQEGYDWQLVVTTAMRTDFLASTRLIASFPNAAFGGDESFDVYTLLATQTDAQPYEK